MLFRSSLPPLPGLAGLAVVAALAACDPPPPAPAASPKIEEDTQHVAVTATSVDAAPVERPEPPRYACDSDADCVIVRTTRPCCKDCGADPKEPHQAVSRVWEADQQVRHEERCKGPGVECPPPPTCGAPPASCNEWSAHCLSGQCRTKMKRKPNCTSEPPVRLAD